MSGELEWWADGELDSSRSCKQNMIQPEASGPDWRQKQKTLSIVEITGARWQNFRPHNSKQPVKKFGREKLLAAKWPNLSKKLQKKGRKILHSNLQGKPSLLGDFCNPLKINSCNIFFLFNFLTFSTGILLKKKFYS
jgi:hypothetical protein